MYLVKQDSSSNSNSFFWSCFLLHHLFINLIVPTYIILFFLKQVKSDQKQQPVEVIERKICLTTESILPSEKEQLTFLSVPPNKSDESDAPEDSYTFVTEAGHGASVCPRGMYCLHFTKVFFFYNFRSKVTSKAQK